METVLLTEHHQYLKTGGSFPASQNWVMGRRERERRMTPEPTLMHKPLVILVQITSLTAPYWGSVGNETLNRARSDHTMASCFSKTPTGQA